jgi:hypothetical protein
MYVSRVSNAGSSAEARFSGSRKEHEGKGTEHLPTCEEYDGEFYTSLTCRLFAQRDLCGHLGIFPALLRLSIRMWLVEWRAWHVMGRRLIYANEEHKNRRDESCMLAHPDRRDEAVRM